MPKEQLKDKLDGNELDLSLSSLDTVPVNELALIPKATRIDLSCNLLTKLPNDFCNLQHIVHLDLSKNQLMELPFNFGGLKKLQHLDLFANKLTTLPVSMFQQKTLKWLDLKDNPLTEPLNSLVGDCLDEKQCRACAKNVLEFMTKVQAEQERQLQKRLQEERALDAKKKAEEERQKNIVKEERKREKERRRKEHEERIAQQKMQEIEKEAPVSKVEQNGKKETTTQKKQQHIKKKKKDGLSCCGVLFAMFVGLLGVLIGVFFYCNRHLEDHFCHQWNNVVDPYLKEGQLIANNLILKASKFINGYINVNKTVTE